MFIATLLWKLPRKRAFENLLDAHGVAWRRQEDGSLLANANEQLAKKDRAGAELKSVASNATAEPDLIYLSAEATPAQIEATLAALTAQPDVFRWVAITPSPTEGRLGGAIHLADEQKSLSKLRLEDARRLLCERPRLGDGEGGQDRTAPLGFAYQQKVQAGGSVSAEPREKRSTWSCKTGLYRKPSNCPHNSASCSCCVW